MSVAHVVRESRMACRNRESTAGPAEAYHLHLSTGQVLAIPLCEGCRREFVTAEWVDAVI